MGETGIGPPSPAISCPDGPVEGEGLSPAHLSVRIDRKSFRKGGTEVRVLEDVAFEVARGEFVSILGPSGCGKTTLLRLIAGLDTDFDGDLRLVGARVSGPGRDRGVVFQESRLLPWLSVASNVAFALPEGIGREVRRRRVDEALRLVGLAGSRDAWPYQLSGGQEKRVALARALVNLPELLLMDEPFAALDVLAKYALQDEVARVHEQRRLTTVLITHDVDECIYLSDRIMIMSDHPATIRRIYEVDLPRPRLRTSDVLAHLRAMILGELLRGDSAEPG
jgi:ABC-type nitrate/sulfonate/bicarbonate transport system ATPase subunit